MNNEIILSLELFALVNWIMKNEKRKLNNLVKHALKNGLVDKFEKISINESTEINEQFYVTIINFLLLIEDCLTKNLNRMKTNKKKNDILLPVLKKMNSYDISTDSIFLKRKKTLKTDNNLTDMKKKLFQQIIKNWKPDKNDLLN